MNEEGILAFTDWVAEQEPIKETKVLAAKGRKLKREKCDRSHKRSFFKDGVQRCEGQVRWELQSGPLTLRARGPWWLWVTDTSVTWWRNKADRSGKECQQLETSGQRRAAVGKGKQGGSCRNDGTRTAEGELSSALLQRCAWAGGGGEMETSLWLWAQGSEFVLSDVQGQVWHTVKAATDGCVGFVPYASRWLRGPSCPPSPKSWVGLSAPFTNNVIVQAVLQRHGHLLPRCKTEVAYRNHRFLNRHIKHYILKMKCYTRGKPPAYYSLMPIPLLLLQRQHHRAFYSLPGLMPLQYMDSPK